MNTQEVKDLIAKSSPIWKQAESSIRDMSLKLYKYKGDKTEQTKNLENLNNLLNLSHKQSIEINNQLETIGKYLMKIGELKHEYDKLVYDKVVLEQVSDLGMDVVVNDVYKSVMIKLETGENTVPFKWLVNTSLKGN